MKAFEVFINGHRLCLAGVGENGVLHAIVNWVGGLDHEEAVRLSVAGLDSDTDEHMRWKVPTIGVGAEVLVKVVETASADPPNERVRSEMPTTLGQYRECLRQFSERMTQDERQQLIKELAADLEGTGS
jgi:hypothetical protein